MTKAKLPQLLKESKHIIYFDYLRIAAICVIVILHIAAQNLRTVKIASPAWTTFNVYDSLTRWGVPIFIMISGALFLGKTQTINKLYKKNISKILIILVFWTLVYNFWQLIISGSSFSLKSFLIYLTTEPYYLWFLYMLIGLYMMVPLLQLIIRNKKKTEYFLILSLIFAFLIPELINIISLKSEFFAKLIENKVAMLRIFMVLGYTGYFVLGYYLNKYNIKRKTEIIIYITGVFGALFTIIATTLSSLIKGELVTFFYDNLTINVAMISISVFIFFKKHFDHRPTPQKNKPLQLLSRCSLGVYLTHVIILETMDSVFSFNSLSFNPVLSVPALSILILFLSYIISISLYKIPFIGKWIV